jgi:hypothetical protein
MQDFVGFEDSKRFGKRHANMDAPPFARGPHPVDIETVRPHAVNGGKGASNLSPRVLSMPTRGAA